MEFDMRSLPLMSRYKILTSTVTPRPIAWITSMASDGALNCAPFSFFNAVGHDPPIIVLGLLKNPDGSFKDTASNIFSTGEFVVNLVSEIDAQKMNLTSVDAPSDVSEIDLAEIETLPSARVKPPRIATSPVSFECKRMAALDLGPGQTVFIGRVIVAHIKDEFISDPEKLYFDTPAMALIGRTHGAGWYARTTDQFKMDRPVYQKPPDKD